MRHGVSVASEADPSHVRRRSRAGFGLLEVLMALAVGGLVLAAVTEVVGRALVRWGDGFGTLARIERVDLALDRIGRDLAAAVPTPGVGDGVETLFLGGPDRFVFVADTALSQSEDGLAVIEIAVDGPAATRVVTRGWRRLDGSGRGRTTLLGGLDVSFAYVDHGGRRSEAWARKGEMPAAVVVAVRGPAGRGGLPSEILLPIRVRIAPSCLAGRLETREPRRPKDPDAARPMITEQVGDAGGGEEEGAREAPSYCLIDGSEALGRVRARGGGEVRP